MKDGFVKTASGTPEIRLADVSFNKESVLRLIDRAAVEGVKILCLPELCLTGYTCGDLFLLETLISGAERALGEILAATAEIDMLFALGVPVRYDGALFNCAAVCCRGKLLGLVPKLYLPDFGEFSEPRWFSSGAVSVNGEITFAGQTARFGADVVFKCESMDYLQVGVEICRDMWVPFPPSASLAASGATVILNLSASNEVVNKAVRRRELVKMLSARLVCGYVFSGSGEGESTADLVFAGHNFIAENGEILTERRFETGLAISELDVSALRFERGRMKTYQDGSIARFSSVSFSLDSGATELTRKVGKAPFIPCGAKSLSEIIRTASLGLSGRMRHTGAKKTVIGVSGGLDSTLAMLICAGALDELKLPRENLIAVTMPGFGTTGRTKNNAETLSGLLGATFREIPIGDAVRQHFADIGHDENNHGAVFENAQARERTQVLMDIANGLGGLVVGTGDMSELALGFTTFNGDHMSMYGVNSGIPKTLARKLVAHVAETDSSLSAVLRDVLETPISPELLPEADGGQITENIVGPYELHDFFLYYMIRWGASPRKTLRLAEYAFKGEYEETEIDKWLRVFIRRFFSQQFKRSCMPDGPKIVDFSLSPRGGWHMPSDASGALWLD